jgi:hypothetical protein
MLFRKGVAHELAPAITLYEKLGVKETVHHFDIAPARRTPAM